MSETPVAFLWWQFFNPERLWAWTVILILLLAYIAILLVRRPRSMRYTQISVLDVVAARQSRWSRHLVVIASLAAFALTVGAWARPVGMEKVPRERATVVIVLDRSLSMQANDVHPTRFEAAKATAKDFVSSLPESYNVSVVALSGSSSVLTPPTTDRQLVNKVIDSMELAEGSAISEAIDAALGAIAMAPGDDTTPPPAAIVMLTDGEDTSQESSADRSANEAKRKQVPIYTIAYGTLNGYVDLDGRRENVPPDKEYLERISQITGGKSLEAKSASQLAEVWKEMRSEVAYEDLPREVSARWALYACLAAMIAAGGVVSMGARWP